MSTFLKMPTTTMPELKHLQDAIIDLLSHTDYSQLHKVYLVSGKIRNHPELQGELALRTEGSMIFTSAALEIKLSSAITLESVDYIRRIFNILENDEFTFTILRPGSTQGKWCRYNNNGTLLESNELGTFGTSQGADFDVSKLDAVINRAQECNDIGILLSESAAYCCKSNTHIQLNGIDISNTSEYDNKTKANVLAFVNAVSKRCATLNYDKMIVSNRNDQKAANMRFTMVDGYIDTINPNGERIVIDAGGGTYKVYYQNNLTRTHLGDIPYDQDMLLRELETINM